MAQRIIPPRTKIRTTFGKNLTYIDMLVLLGYLVIVGFVAFLKIGLLPKLIMIGLVLAFALASIIDLGNETKTYVYFGQMFKFLLRNKTIESFKISDLKIKFEEEHFKLRNHIISVVEVEGIDFGILSEFQQDQKIMILKNLFSKIPNGKIIKLDVPIDFTSFSQDHKKREKVLKKASLKNHVSYLKRERVCLSVWTKEKVITKPVFYLLIYSESLTDHTSIVDFALSYLEEASLKPMLLKGKNQFQFFQKFYNSNLPYENFIVPKAKEHIGTIKYNGEKYAFATIYKLPLFSSNAWLSDLFSLDDVKVSLTFCRKKDKVKVMNSLNKATVELSDRYISKTATESVRTDLDYKIGGIKNLIEELSIGSEDLYDIELLLFFPEKLTQKVKETFKTANIYINTLTFNQGNAYYNFQPFDFKCSLSNCNLTTSTLASTFPFISNLHLDKYGQYFGYSSSVVFFDLFYSWRNSGSKRTNANMVILGKPGSGKSYFSKKLLLEQAFDNCKIFVLDPENEYTHLSKSLNGSFADVGGVRTGTINPLQVFPSLVDTDEETGEKADELSQHRQFLEAFFRVVLTGITQELLSLLNLAIKELYENFEITEKTDCSLVSPENFPTFEDLAQLIDNKLEVLNKTNAGRTSYEYSSYRKLKIYLSDFRTGGIHSRLWNGKTTFTTDNKFTVLNFQSLFASNNQIVANGQMLVLMRYLMQEIIKNKEQNDSQNEKSNIVIMIDEAHQFINPEFPVALTFMSQMVKRIRKYGGSMIIATQNIKDFIGYSDSTKTQATAVINGCQYSMLFGLNPDDVNSVVDLYKGYNGGLTDTEKQQLANANRGEALLIVDANNRLIFKVDLFNDQEGLFQ